MRRTAGLIVILLVLSACGTKGPLYLPPPLQKPQQQQDSKPAPRQ
ncbi:MAG: lipoprotein [Burkholderiales bacterium]